MQGTIEPRRLNALLNDTPSDKLGQYELAPLQHHHGLNTSGRALILEPGTPRNQQSSLALVSFDEFISFDGDVPQSHHGRLGPLPGQATPTHITSSQSLRKILADELEPAAAATRKRSRKDLFVQLPQPEKRQKGPAQAVQQLILPPTIVGLHEPPLNQAPQFAPITSSPFHDSHGRNTLNASQAEITAAGTLRLAQPERHPRTSGGMLDTFAAVSAESPFEENRKPLQLNSNENNVRSTDTGRNDVRVMRGQRQLMPKSPSRIALQVSTNNASQEPQPQNVAPQVKAWNKFSKQETEHLLRGVRKHKIGNWKKIFEDPEFTFNNRKAGQLKDRFRIVCPDAYANHTRKTTGSMIAVECAAAEDERSLPSRISARPSIEPILSSDSSSPTTPRALPSRKKNPPTKSAESLKELATSQPFEKVPRRGRRSYAEEEDKNILLGFEKYGCAAWTKIKRDPALKLESRQATDLRDRFRTRWPERYRVAMARAREEKDGSEKAAEGGSGAAVFVVGRNGQNNIEGPAQHNGVVEEQAPAASASASISTYPDILSSTDPCPPTPVSPPHQRATISFMELLNGRDDAFPDWAGTENDNGLSSIEDMMGISRLLLDENWPDGSVNAGMSSAAGYVSPYGDAGRGNLELSNILNGTVPGRRG